MKTQELAVRYHLLRRALENIEESIELDNIPSQEEVELQKQETLKVHLSYIVGSAAERIAMPRDEKSTVVSYNGFRWHMDGIPGFKYINPREFEIWFSEAINGNVPELVKISQYGRFSIESTLQTDWENLLFTGVTGTGKTDLFEVSFDALGEKAELLINFVSNISESFHM